MKQIDNLAELAKELGNFDPISLAKTQKAALMDRVEQKFLLSTQELLKILPLVRESYQILEIGGEVMMAYNSTYHDSQDFAFYRAHHDGRLRRQKVRFRRYLQTDASFLEIKLRSPSGRTRKERIAVEETSTTGEHSSHFLHEQLPNCAELEPKLEVFYQRATLVSRVAEERLTLDFGLSLGKPGEVSRTTFNRAVVAELKHSVDAKTSIFETVAREHHLYSGSFSKYGVGCSLSYRDLKYNNFKPQFLAIDKVQHGRR